MTNEELEQALLEAAKRLVASGPGYSQESVVLRDHSTPLAAAVAA
jgi:hypothetical protein